MYKNIKIKSPTQLAAKLILPLTLFAGFLLFSEAVFAQKNPTSVEEAEKAIAKKKNKEGKAAAKAKKAAEKEHWARQSPEARKSIKRNKKKNKKIQRTVKKNQRRQKNYTKQTFE
jgi:hypothetical protein